LERCIAVTLDKASYLELWPDEMRVSGKLDCLRNSCLFGKSYSLREMALLTHAMQLVEYRHGTAVPLRESLYLVAAGLCKVLMRRPASSTAAPVPIAILGHGETFGEVCCVPAREAEAPYGDRKATPRDDGLVYVADGHLELFRISALVVQTVLGSGSLERLRRVAAIKKGWRMRHMSSQHHVVAGESGESQEQRAAHAKSRLLLELSDAFQASAHITKEARNSEPRLAPGQRFLPSEYRPPVGRIRGNVFMGDSWQDPHLRRDPKQDALDEDRAIRRHREEHELQLLQQQRQQQQQPSQQQPSQQQPSQPQPQPQPQQPQQLQQAETPHFATTERVRPSVLVMHKCLDQCVALPSSSQAPTLGLAPMLSKFGRKLLPNR
jgi:hypothetical protein